MNRERRRVKHSVCSLLITAFAVVSAFFYVMNVSAGGTNSFLQGYYVQDGSLTVQCASLADIGEDGETRQFTVTISGKECPVQSISTVEEAGEGVTFYCLVDVSGSMRQEQMEAAKEVLMAICEGLREQDNMVIGALGTTLEVSSFLTDREEIRSGIDALAAGSDYTAIYDAVTDSIAVLQSSKECNRKKCLVLISDGDDETEMGKTRNDAMRAIEDSRIPVYTVAVLRQSNTQQQRESAKKLGEFARQSVGGMDLVPAVNEYSAKEAGNLILEDIYNGLILTLDASQADLPRDEALLRVQLEMDSAVYSDDMYVYTADLSGLSDGKEPQPTPEPPTPSPIPEPTPSVTPEPKPEPEPSRLLIYLAVLAALAVVALVVSALLLSRNRKKREEEERQAQERQQRERQEQERRQQIEQEEQARRARDSTPPSGLIGSQTVGASAGVWYEVRFVAIDHEDIVFTLKLQEGKAVTIGRNNKADMVFNPNDRHLSSVQCRLCCRQGAMNVWDMDSRNDTFVNGVPIHKIGMATVQNGDVMRLGSYEYRVLITRK